VSALKKESKHASRVGKPFFCSVCAAITLEIAICALLAPFHYKNIHVIMFTTIGRSFKIRTILPHVADLKRLIESNAMRLAKNKYMVGFRKSIKDIFDLKHPLPHFYGVT
jgi:hypothetical protein